MVIIYLAYTNNRFLSTEYINKEERIKMLKRILIAVMLFALLAIVSAGLLYTPPIKEVSTQNASRIAINNTPIKERPITREGITYLPLRAVCTKLGYKVKWENDVTTLKKDKMTITLRDNKATIRKKEYKMKKIIAHNNLLINSGTAYMSIQGMRDILELSIKKEGTAINILYNPLQEDYITFNDGLGDNTLPFKYSDDYFDSTAFEYSPELAQLCTVLSSGAHAMSSMSKGYKKMGFAAEFYNYTTVNRTTSAYSIAAKELDDRKIYIINIRGTSGDEWYTNFDIYKDKNTPSANHYGFSQAEQDVRDTLKQHLEKDGYKGRRIFLITGHSRGGAVANILGAHLTTDKRYAQPQDIYTYTFATPNVSTIADSNMKNIYNFCNASDFITKLPMNGREYDNAEKEWTYSKNGTTVVFDNTDIKQTKLTADMEREFKAVTGKEFITIKKDAVQTAVLSLKMLLPTVMDYYTKPLGIGNIQMSAYEFFISGLAASQTLGAAAEQGMMLIADGLFKGDMSDVAKFIVFNSMGSTKNNADGSIAEKGQGIKYNHSCEAYYAWVKAYNKEYFNR